MSLILISDFVTVFLIFVRVTAFFLSAPFFSNTNLPKLPLAFVAFTISLIIFFTVPTILFDFNSGIMMLAFVAVKEAIIGLVLGFSLNFVFYGIMFAGQMIGFELGLSIANAFDPSADMQNNVFGEILNFSAVVIFLIVNGHHEIIRGLAASFELVKLGQLSINEPLYSLLITYSTGMFVIAIKIAMPITAAFFLVNIASGLISRMIPQMQVFFVTMPLKVALGLLLLIALMPFFVYLVVRFFEQIKDYMWQLIKTMSQ